MSDKKMLKDEELEGASGGAVSILVSGNYVKEDRIVDGQYQFSADGENWYTLAPQHAEKFDSPEATQAWMHEEAHWHPLLRSTRLTESDIVPV